MLNKNIVDEMENITSNCMGESAAGCVAGCPMHTDVKTYVNLIRDGKGKEAIKVIRDKLFIPRTLGRVCAHPCETECKLSEIKAPMAIAHLKRYAGDNFDNEADWDYSKKENNGKHISIIGAGPAGLQAGLDLIKEGCNVTIYEKQPVRGGMMAVGIPEYRLPNAILDKEISYLDKLGVKFELNCEIGKDISFDEIVEKSDSVIIAVGKHIGNIDRSLKNSDADGIFSAVDFTREAKLTLDVKNVYGNVLVIGGGDVAMDCARISTRLKDVKNVYSACLECGFDTMPANNIELKEATEEGVIFNHGYAIKEIIVNEQNRVKKVILKKCLSMFDEKGVFSPKYDENDTKELDVDTIVFSIGQRVDSAFVNGKIETKPNSNFDCDEITLQSKSNEKVFIAGDCSGYSVIVIQAMATGRRCAESVMRYLNGQDLTKDRNLDETKAYKTTLETTVDWSTFTKKPMSMPTIPVEERKSFKEVDTGYTEEIALNESSRCQKCECRLCVKDCVMLDHFTHSPKVLFGQYMKEGYTNMEKLIAFSCNECGLCTIKCPKDFKIREVFTGIKEQYVKDNDEKQVIEELKDYDRIQAMECSKKYSTTILAKDNKKTKYLFVPGCTMPVYSPELMEKTLEHLRETLNGEVGAMLQCCGKVTKMNAEIKKFEHRNKMAVDEINLTNADVIVTICPSCYRTYSDTCDTPVISYWDLMKEQIGLPKGQENIGANSDVVFNIHDSCVTRDVVSHHESIRWILDGLGYKYEEIEYNGTNTRCCGVGGMVSSSNPELYKKIYSRRAAEFNQNHVISYCGSCRATFENAGKDSVHILNLIHYGEYNSQSAQKRNYKDEEEMWEKRLKTKELFDAINTK